jgi:hypothetical protein
MRSQCRRNMRQPPRPSQSATDRWRFRKPRPHRLRREGPEGVHQDARRQQRKARSALHRERGRDRHRVRHRSLGNQYRDQRAASAITSRMRRAPPGTRRSSHYAALQATGMAPWAFQHAWRIGVRSAARAAPRAGAVKPGRRVDLTSGSAFPG